jgi:hypothetical protein
MSNRVAGALDHHLMVVTLDVSTGSGDIFLNRQCGRIEHNRGKDSRRGIEYVKINIVLAVIKVHEHSQVSEGRVGRSKCSKIRVEEAHP